MYAKYKLEEELERHAQRVRQGEHGQQRVARLGIVADEFVGTCYVAYNGSVGNHNTLGVGSGTRGVVYDSKFLSLIFVIAKVFLSKT